MKLKRTTVIVTTLAALLFCGCTWHDPYRAEVGVATMQDIERHFGKPESISKSTNGEAWLYTKIGASKTRTGTFIFTNGVFAGFDSPGSVKTVGKSR